MRRCTRLYEHCIKRHPCGACETAKPAISPTPPDFKAEVRRALRRPSDTELIRSFGVIGEGTKVSHDFTRSIAWAKPVVPIKHMTEAQRRAELGRILKGWKA